MLPAITVGLASAAYIARLVRSSMLETLRQDYVNTARAKGLHARIVVSSHALKNALIPMVTCFGIQLAGLLTGAVVTEQVFSRPGLGRVAITAIRNRDFPLIQGTVLVTAVIMRWVDIMLAFPGILLAMALVAILGSSLFNVMLAVGIAAIPEYTRVVRGTVLSAREAEYVVAARATGAPDRSIVLRHILPNVLPPVIVLATRGIAGAIILGSTLSFLGLGIKPPTPEWGNMLADGRSMLRHQWWVSLFPGLAIMLTVLAISLLGDGLRDALDPRIRSR